MIQAAKRLFQFRAAGGAYDAVDGSRKRRRQPSRAGKSEDAVLNDSKRRLLSGTTQDIQRNFAIAAWAIRQHLNYVSSFQFQSRTGNEAVDGAVDNFMTNWMKRENCDVRKRHPFRRVIRLAEAMRVVHGDLLLMKLTGKGVRGKLQPIEGDRVLTPDRKTIVKYGLDDKSWVNGVKIDSHGAAAWYAIHNRTDNVGQYELDRVIKSQSAFPFGYYERFDQVRGVSPIASALSSLQDVYEGFDYALAKVKVSQLFGLAIYRDATEGLDGAEATLDTDGDDVADDGYEIDFSGGPQIMDLNPGDRAEFLESRSPPMETMEFLKLIIHVSIKALDLPYSFFDEAHTNFYGSRAGLIQYLHSCKSKIQDMTDLLDDITRWRLGLAIADGQLQIPGSVSDLVWEWVPAGVPWWDPVKEVKGLTMALDAGLDNPQRICRQNGTDFYKNIDQIAEAQAYAEQRGVSINFTSTGASNGNGNNQGASEGTDVDD